MIRRFLSAALLGSLVLVLAGCGDDDAASGTLAGYVREPTPVVSELSLPDATNGGEPLVFEAADGEFLLVYFGYTSCPDVCPTTLSDVRTALEDLGEEDAAVIDLAMATIDPDRDVDEVIGGYVQSFVSGAHGLRTTDDAELRAAANAFGVEYSVDTNAEGEVEVVHSGSLYVVDDQGQLVLTWPFGTPVDDLVNDLRLLLEAKV
ncbi:MAG: SCO family protein [Acidimicrobiales bacterium]